MVKRTTLAVKLALAQAETTSPEILRELAKSHNFWLQRAIISNFRIPEDTLADFARNKRSGVRMAVAMASHTPAWILQFLASDHHDLVRRAVAMNPNTPIFSLQALVNDIYPGVHLGLAQNPNTPAIIMESLVDRLGKKGRKRLAGIVRYSPSIVKRLSKDPVLQVRYKVAHNPNLDSDMVLGLLETDDLGQMRNVARRKHGLPALAIIQLWATGDPEILRSLAMNSKIL
ncbi:hypothetical protein [Sphingobium subterraneum]|uniref:Leucine rich repeat variant n=1 Tax=Sphingobium subterraneum TaxID=627688 RepID=A0A841IYW3_9SPHN|nr:hypothetical protein [Sphingobium subterraneum]MBB6123853.1 hypothetical protein [Sphingobium subterraneum]